MMRIQVLNANLALIQVVTFVLLNTIIEVYAVLAMIVFSTTCVVMML